MNPSLALIPSAYKADKLYSVLPEDGTGDFTVSRNGTATYLDSDGLIKTAQANEPRLEFNQDGTFKGVLDEPAASNLLLRSEEFNLSPWNVVASASVNANSAIAPNGISTADTINLAQLPDSRLFQIANIQNNTTYTLSCFFKNISLTSGQTFNFRVNNFLATPNSLVVIATIDLALGTVVASQQATDGTGISGAVTANITNFGNGWFRVSLTFKVGTSGANAAGVQIISNNARSFYAWGAQLEVGSVATSYIPTYGSTVTRPADVITRTNAQDLIGQTEGTIYAEFTITNLNKFSYILTISSDFTGSNTVSIALEDNNIFRMIVRANSTQVFARDSSSISTGVYKIAFAYKSGNSRVCINGSLLTANSQTFDFSTQLSNLIIGSLNLTSRFLNDHVQKIAIFKSRLSDTQLQALTTL